MSTKRVGAALAIAEHFGSDVADIREGRYQSTRTSQQVFVVGDDYYTAAPVNKTVKDMDGFTWMPLNSWIKEKFKWEVYQSVKQVDD